jgi:hypothetical protein
MSKADTSHNRIEYTTIMDIPEPAQEQALSFGTLRKSAVVK